MMIDSDHPDVIAFAGRAIGDASGTCERAIKLFYAVRDGFRYDPYKIDLSPDGLKASRVLADGYGWCVTKSVLLAAACRVAGIPSRVGFADVRNHLSTTRLREAMGTDIFYFHGYTTLFIGDRWMKATPAFNVELCQKLNIRSLEFDGTSDSIYHQFDLAGQRHMEYLNFRGEYDEVPQSMLVQGFAKYYPNLPRLDDASWDADVDEEAAG